MKLLLVFLHLIGVVVSAGSIAFEKYLDFCAKKKAALDTAIQSNNVEQINRICDKVDAYKRDFEMRLGHFSSEQAVWNVSRGNEIWDFYRQAMEPFALEILQHFPLNRRPLPPRPNSNIQLPPPPALANQVQPAVVANQVQKMFSARKKLQKDSMDVENFSLTPSLFNSPPNSAPNSPVIDVSKSPSVSRIANTNNTDIIMDDDTVGRTSRGKKVARRETTSASAPVLSPKKVPHPVATPILVKNPINILSQFNIQPATPVAVPALPADPRNNTQRVLPNAPQSNNQRVLPNAPQNNNQPVAPVAPRDQYVMPISVIQPRKRVLVVPPQEPTPFPTVSFMPFSNQGLNDILNQMNELTQTFVQNARGSPDACARALEFRQHFHMLIVRLQGSFTQLLPQSSAQSLWTHLAGTFGAITGKVINDKCTSQR